MNTFAKGPETQLTMIKSFINCSITVAWQKNKKNPKNKRKLKRMKVETKTQIKNDQQRNKTVRLVFMLCVHTQRYCATQIKHIGVCNVLL